MTYFILLWIVILIVFPIVDFILSVLGIDATWTAVYAGMTILLLGMVLDNQRKILSRLEAKGE